MPSPYPSSTKLLQQYSIVSIAFKHAISFSPKDLIFQEWTQKLEAYNWRTHDFLLGIGSRNGIDVFDSQTETFHRSFFKPQNIFNPNSQEMTFGFQGTASPSSETTKEIIKRQLDPRQNVSGSKSTYYADNLLLTLDPSESNFLQKNLLYQHKNIKITFQIEWADTWFFNDLTGILSFKAQIIDVHENDKARPHTITDLSILNRRLRNLIENDKKKDDEKITLQPTKGSNNQDGMWLWRDVIYQQWLGVNTKGSINILGSKISPNTQKKYHQTTDLINFFKIHHIDKFTRNAKIITMGHISNLDGEEPQNPKKREQIEFLWNAPVTDPPVDFSEHTESIYSGKRPEIFGAYHFATMEGYPTKGDFLLYDLASTGNEGDAMGEGDRTWQISPEYLRYLLGEHGIEIWEYWRGMALHDTLAFLSYQEKMPIIYQAESYYYPLYIYFYHVQFKLNCFSSEIIDQELNDVLQSRDIKDRFNKFRNQYWFTDVTVDFQGVEIARKIKTGLQINNLFETVSSEIGEISDYVDDKMDKGKQSFITFMVLALYPLFVIFDLIQIWSFHDWFISKIQTHPIVVSIFIVFIVALFVTIVPRYIANITNMLKRIYAYFYHQGQL